MQIAVVLCILFSLITCFDGAFICMNDGMFENFNDPHSFWHCANGNPYLKQCPASLIWSQTIQGCTWDVVVPVIAVTTSSPPATMTTTPTVPMTTSTSSSFPPQCSDYMSITDGTRRTNNTITVAETDHSYFSSKTTWVRFEGAAGTRLAEDSVPANRCGAEGAGWLKYPIEPEIGMTIKQTACFNWGGVSCIWPLKIPMTNCGDFFVYGLVAPALLHGRYCTV